MGEPAIRTLREAGTTPARLAAILAPVAQFAIRALLFIAAMAVPVAARAQVAALGSSATASGADLLTGVTIPAGNNRVLLVTVSNADLSSGGGPTTFTVKYNGQTMTQAAATTVGGAAHNSIYTFALGGSGSASTGNSVAVTRPAGVTTLNTLVTAQVFANVDQANPVASSNLGSTNSSTPSISTTYVSAAGDRVFEIVDVYAAGSTVVATPASGQTVLATQPITYPGSFASYSGVSVYKTATLSGAASVTSTWTTTTDATIQIGVSLKQAIAAAPAVTTNPVDATVPVGNTATFTAAATGAPTPTVQWQFSTDGGATYGNVAGATSTTLSVPNVTALQNGTKFKAVFTNSAGSATTTIATLTVNFAPSVTTNPANQSVTAGSNASFTAAASGNPAPSTQWQLSTDGGATWANVVGATSTTLSLAAVPLGANGDKYRAVFTNSRGTATTTAATLTVNPGAATHFSVAATSPQTAGTAFNVSVTALDAGNNTATSYAGAVGFGSGDPAAVLPANSTLTNGVGTFTITLKTAGVWRVAAIDTLNGSIGGTGSPITVNPGAPASLAFAQQPSNTVSNASISPAPTVLIFDAFGNLTTSNVNVALHLADNPGGGTLSGATLVASAAGVATFPGLSIDKAGNGYDLAATAAAIPFVVSSTFNIAAGAPASATADPAATPQSAPILIAFTTPLAVTVRDAAGNPVSGANVTFTAPATGASGLFSNNATAITGQTDANGLASASFSANATPGGPYSVTAAVSGVATPATFSLTNAKTPQTITFSSTPPARPLVAATYPVAATATSGLAVSFSLDASSGAGVCSLSGATVSFIKVGACVIDADQAGDATRAAAPQVQQTLTVTNIVEYALSGPNNFPTFIAAGPDGATWFAEFNSSRIGRIDPVTKAITRFSAGMTANAGPWGIAQGPDGAMWFAESNIDKIGRIDVTTHAITEYPVPAAACNPPPCAGVNEIVAGPDGAMWFTEAYANAIGRIDVATGAVTNFTSGITAGGEPYGIAAGPDGAIWFTESQGNNIGRLDPATGVIAEFPVSAAAGNTEIAAGPDGAMWFTEFFGNAIGRIDPVTHAITEYPIGAPGAAYPSGIAAGPDGAIWFGDYTGVRIGRIDPANGAIAEFATGQFSNGGSLGIATGPDGNLWFADLGVNKIGELFPPAYTLPAPAPAAIFPPSGPAAGGARAIVMGGGLFGVSYAAFAGTPAASFSFVSPTTLFVTTPARPAGRASVDTLNASGPNTTSTTYTFLPGPAARFQVVASSPQTAGAAFNVTVTALDAQNNVATGYTGTARFAGTDGLSVLPGDYSFIAADNGVHTFTNGVTLKTAGTQTITATDTVTASITGTSGAILVNPGAASQMTANAGTTPQSAVILKTFANALAVTVKDAQGNVTPGVNVAFTAPGSGFSGTFSNTTATITVATDASGVATAAFTANATIGGPYNVTAAASGVTTVTFALTNLTPPPTVTAISPATGPVTGGTLVTITGTVLTGASSVTIGGTAATNVNVVNATTITATTPAHALGAASVLVTTVGGANAANSLFTFLPLAPTASVALAPPALPPNGVSRMTVTLTNPNVTPLSGVADTVSLPAGVVVKASPAATTTCSGASVAAAGGSSSVALTGGALAAGATCVFQASLVASKPGRYTIPAGTPSATGAAPGVAGNTAILASRAARDFDGDGKSDILWRNSAGDLSVWLMNGTTRIGGGTTFATVAANSGWTFTGTADFNADGKADLLWRHVNGDIGLWLMDGTLSLGPGNGEIGNVSIDWTMVGTGDFDGDGKTDILWRHSGGDVAIWLMDGGTRTGGATIGNVSTDWTIQGVGDFDGDGKTDILWRHSGGEVAIWLMNGTAQTGGGTVGAVPAASGWSIAGTGDFDGDGKTDILWRHANGDVAVWLMNGATVTGGGTVGNLPQATGWIVAGTGDYDGDGHCDILWRNTVTGQVAIWLMNGATLAGGGTFATVPLDWTVMSGGN